MSTVVWMRLGKRDVHCAHAYVDGEQLCNMQHGRFGITPRTPVEPYPVDLGPHGVPYGRTCQRCLKLAAR